MINEWTRGCVAEGVTGDFTLAAWVKLAPGTNGNCGGIAGKLVHLDTPEYRGISLVRYSSNVFRLWVGDGTGDLVHEFDVTGGSVEFTAMQYMPSGTTCFILMNTYNSVGAAQVRHRHGRQHDR